MIFMGIICEPRRTSSSEDFRPVQKQRTIIQTDSSFFYMYVLSRYGCGGTFIFSDKKLNSASSNTAMFGQRDLLCWKLHTRNNSNQLITQPNLPEATRIWRLDWSCGQSRKLHNIFWQKAKFGRDEQSGNQSKNSYSSTPFLPQENSCYFSDEIVERELLFCRRLSYIFFIAEAHTSRYAHGESTVGVDEIHLPWTVSDRAGRCNLYHAGPYSIIVTMFIGFFIVKLSNTT